MASVINKESEDNQSNRVVVDPPKPSTVIRHKRGEYDENKLARLKDGEIFYDTTGEHGIYMGVYNQYTKKIDIVKIAGLSGEIEVKDFLKVLDVVAVLDEGVVYDARKVLSANAGNALKASISSLDTRLTSVESSLVTKVREEVDKYLAECKVLTEDSLVSGDSISITKDASGKLQIGLIWKE